MKRSSIGWTVLTLLSAAAGLGFSAVSTFDFAQHLDRQTHGLHCSFIPGLGAADMSGATGCHVALMSPYSSIFRKVVWGGIPLSALATGVFAFLIFAAIALMVRKALSDARATFMFVVAWAVPVAASVTMGAIASRELGTFCKVCVGIYVSSGVGFLAAIAAAVSGARNRAVDDLVRPPIGRSARFPIREQTSLDAETVPSADTLRAQGHDEAEPAGPVSWAFVGLGVLLGVLFVAAPGSAWLATAPAHEKYLGTCGSLRESAVDDNIAVRFPATPASAPAIELLDPLCPSCRALERRLRASEQVHQLDRTIVLFPLDNTCNWMVSTAVHPGACAVAEAVLCAGTEGKTVIDWAFDHQSQLQEIGKADPAAVKRSVLERFPRLRECVGSAAVRARLGRSMRWAVRNELPVLTPQLFVRGTKVCDEDVDLGLDFALSRMIDAPAGGAR